MSALFPVLENRDMQIPGAYQLASTAQQMSYRFTERPCLKEQVGSRRGWWLMLTSDLWPPYEPIHHTHTHKHTTHPPIYTPHTHTHHHPCSISSITLSSSMLTSHQMDYLLPGNNHLLVALFCSRELYSPMPTDFCIGWSIPWTVWSKFWLTQGQRVTGTGQ